MKIDWAVDTRTDRCESVLFRADTFQEEKLLGRLTDVWQHGGKLLIVVGDIEYEYVLKGGVLKKTEGHHGE